MSAKILISDIQRAVASDFGVPLESMSAGDVRNQRFSKQTRARIVAMGLSLRLTEHGPRKVGYLFHRDHSTVLYAAQQIDTDAGLRDAAKRLTLQLVAQ